jgi:L-lactate dehydrogenase complex protein LldG
MNTRATILNKLRTTLARPDLRFPPVDAPPLTAIERMTVTSAGGDRLALAQRFGQELSKLTGSFEIIETAAEARLAVINRLLGWKKEDEAARKGAYVETGQESQVLSWDFAALPLVGLAPALNDLGMELVAPRQLRSAENRADVRHIRYGLTGVEAAFASTGSLLVVSGAQTPHSASLLPFRHIALIPFSRLFPTIEAWLDVQRKGDPTAYLRSHANLALITGPSKSADIEGTLTLGVHGPKFVHAILFNDAELSDDAERTRSLLR